MEVNSKSYFFEIWAGIGLMTILIVWNLPWRFQVNDDLIMMWLVSGAYTGTPEAYAVFIHPILSWVFSEAYTFTPEFSWYPATWFCILYLSYFLILKKITEIPASKPWKNFLSGLVLMTVIHFCFFLQFTIVAGLASLAGLLILDSGKGEYSKAIFFVAWSMILLSLMVRWESMVLVGMGFLLFNLLYKPKTEIKSILRLFFILFIVFGLTLGSKYYWEFNSEYSDFLSFNKARASVIDHPVFYEQLKSNGIEKGSMWFFFARWMFEDEKISISDLELKKQELNAGLYSFDLMVNSLKRFFSVQKMEAFKSFLSISIILLSLFFAGKKGKMVAFLASWILFMLLVNHFFILNGRVTILFFLVFLFPLLNFSTFPNFKPWIFAGAFMGLFGLFTFHCLNFMEEARGRKIMHQEFENLLQQIPNNELVILEGYMEHNYYFDYSQRKQVPILSLGWISRSPFQKKALAKFGISSLAEAKNYSLFGIRQQQEALYFPEYMNSISTPFEQKESKESPNFVLLRFSKK